MISLQDAQQMILSACLPLPALSVPLEASLGCVTAGSVVATHPVPSFANSAMDGFALRSEDLTQVPTRLRVVSSIPAGTVSDRTLRSGEAARIMTGAPLPPGADAVCQVEQTAGGLDALTVDILAALGRGANVRYPGEDVKPGDTVIAAGSCLLPAHIGLLASLGITEVSVIPAPRVGVLSTGDELTTAPGTLAPGLIRDANRPGLIAALRQMGCLPVDLGIVGDDEEMVVSTLVAGASSCDAVIASGGVSVGDFDVMRNVLKRVCPATTRSLQIALKPARPFAFGTWGSSQTPVFGLPGNPVAALVAFELMVRPALRKLGGHRLVHHPVLRGFASSPLTRRPDGKLHAICAVASLTREGVLGVRPAGPQASHLLRTMADSNALVLLADGEGVDAGDTVDVVLLALDAIERV